MVVQIHDKGYKKLFKNRVIFQQLIQTFINASWVSDLDFNDCETLDKSFISDHYKATESDIIYRIRLRDRNIYVYVLLEFQSTVDHFMAIRVLHYITGFYMDYKESYKNIMKLPAVFPLVLYNGSQKWDAPVRVEDLIETPELFGRFALNFEYFKVAENEFTKESLLRIRNIVSTLFLAETQYDPELLIKELVSLFAREEDRQAVSLLLNWLKQLSRHGRISDEDYEQFDYVYKTSEEVKSMLVEALEKERQKFRAQGKAESIIKFLEFKFRMILPNDLKEKINSIYQLNILDDLVMQAAQVERLEDFLLVLKKHGIQID